MPQLDAITGYINQSLQADQFAGMKFQHSQWNVVADIQEKTSPVTGQFFPGIIDNKGEIQDLSLDDTYNLQVYHIIDNLNYTLDQNSDYGKPGHVMQEIASMRMVMYGDRAKLNIRPEEIVAAAVLDIPKELAFSAVTALNLNDAFIVVDSINTNSYSVFSTDWKNVDYTYKPSNFFIAISYRIITLYNKNCYQICPTS